MKYNTEREKLIIPEYGRNIQQMIQQVVEIENREERTRAAFGLVKIMAQMNPHLKELGDVRHKLWDHLYIISDFKLDVDSPFEPPSQEALEARPQRIGYQNNKLMYRHYGVNIQNIITEAIKYEEGPEKEALVRVIANHLKKSYLNWNRESVNDELIVEQLERLSGGKLKLLEADRLHHTNEILARSKGKKKFTTTKNNGGGKGKRDRNR